MDRVRLVHTAQLSRRELHAVRRLLEGAFGDGGGDEGLTEDDFEHALGGIHALAWETDELIGHGCVVMRRVFHQGRALRTGYVEAVAVRADRRRRGVAGAVMDELEALIRRGYELGALSASDAGAVFYAARGWQVWDGTTSVIAPDAGITRTPDEDGSVFVLPVTAQLIRGGDLACDWRSGDVW